MSIIAPHYCCGCDKTGPLLCENCKYNIIAEQESTCLVCGRPCGPSGVCDCCSVPYDRAWCVGKRDGQLQRLVGLYKFERARSAYRDLGDLLLAVLPELPPDTIIVPVPTAPSRVRERGYDHMKLIAAYVAKHRGLTCRPALKRRGNAKQRQADAKKRENQAAEAFYVDGDLEKGRPYLIIDDVMTTGATIKHCALSLKKSGVKHVWVAVIARQQN